MDGGGHLGPLSYVYGYRAGIGRRRVGQDTTIESDVYVRDAVTAHSLTVHGVMQVRVLSLSPSSRVTF